MSTTALEPALQVNKLSKRFGGERRLLGKDKPSVHAVSDITFTVQNGETLGIVGESGCGKSTLARMLVGLLPRSEGSIKLQGKEQRPTGRLIQYVFQDPISSLNPRKTIRQTMEMPLRQLLKLSRSEAAQRIDTIFAAVNLRSEFLDRYPHEFSGGQAQRIGIARALAASADILILDEPVSALDVSGQAQVLNLLDELKTQFNLTYLFISHDLTVVESVADRVAVLYFGRLVEQGPAASIFSKPRHPYTRLLAESAPIVGRPLAAPENMSMELPDPLRPPLGCAFATRCPRAQSRCQTEVPTLQPFRSTHPQSTQEATEVACFFPLTDD